MSRRPAGNTKGWADRDRSRSGASRSLVPGLRTGSLGGTAKGMGKSKKCCAAKVKPG